MTGMQAAAMFGRLLPLLVVAASPPPPVAIAMERGFVCPERLPDDDARILSVRKFVERYGAMVPKSTVAERLAFRETLLRKHRCQPERLQHNFPET